MVGTTHSGTKRSCPLTRKGLHRLPFAKARLVAIITFRELCCVCFLCKEEIDRGAETDPLMDQTLIASTDQSVDFKPTIGMNSVTFGYRNGSVFAFMFLPSICSKSTDQCFQNRIGE